MSARAWRLVVLLAAAGCTKRGVEVMPTEPAGVPTVELSAPLTVRWEEQARTEGQVRLVAHVTRVTAVGVPFEVHLDVPAGATLVYGRPSFSIPENGEADDVTEVYELSFAAVPAGDLVLRVDGEVDDMGFHVKVPYRFGRPAPSGPRPVANGPSSSHGGRDLGPSIPLTTP
jgi:hypothetical protein